MLVFYLRFKMSSITLEIQDVSMILCIILYGCRTEYIHKNAIINTCIIFIELLTPPFISKHDYLRKFILMV